MGITNTHIFNTEYISKLKDNKEKLVVLIERSICANYIFASTMKENKLLTDMEWIMYLQFYNYFKSIKFFHFFQKFHKFICMLQKFIY